MKDTDTDWKEYGDFEPYYGVLTHDRFLRKNLTDEVLEEFWDTGRLFINQAWAEVQRIFGERHPKSAIDFGCGVGRLTRAIAEIAEAVTGVDVSPGMIEEGRSRALSNMSFETQIPDGPFDWINSYIVFQHIPPSRGYELLEQLLSRAAPECILTLHFSLFKDSRGLRDHGLNSMVYGTWDGERINPLLPRDLGHTMMMYDYDLTRIFAMLVSHGFTRSFVTHEDHAGAHTARIYAAR